MSSITIPLIDCSPIANGAFEDVNDENFEKVAKEIGAAMSGIGMCNIINHGVDKKKIEKILEVSKAFFELPAEKKLKYRKRAPRKSFHGYNKPGDEFLNEKENNSTELREFWDTWGFDALDEKKYPMEEVPDFKAAFDQVRVDLENVGKKILCCLEKCLGLEDGFLISKHKNLGDYSVKSQTALRSTYYYHLNPNENLPANAIRCGEHSDWGTVTLVIQDMVGGLEVKTSDGDWIKASPVKDAILMNSGQLLEYWTGGLFHAAPHRVRIITEGRPSKQPRQSFIFSMNPDGDTKVHPVVPTLPEKEAQFAKYNKKALIAFDHFQKRIENAYAY